MQQSAINRDRFYVSEHETTRNEVKAERKTEEQKLAHLKKLLQTKVHAASSTSMGIQAA